LAAYEQVTPLRQHPAQQDALGQVTNTGRGASHVVQTHLVTHLATEFHAASSNDPHRKHARRQPTRLSHTHLTGPQQATIKQNLRHFGLTCLNRWRGENQTFLYLQSFEQPLLD
jgi:hypothetical protein